MFFLLLSLSQQDSQKRLEWFDSTFFKPLHDNNSISVRHRSFENSNSFLPMSLFSSMIVILSPDLLDLGRPALDALALATDSNIDLGLALHSPRALKERVARHAAGVGALGGHELEHGEEEFADAAGLFHAKVVFLAQHVGQGPVAQAVDVAELAFAVEDLLRPLAADAQRFGKRAQQLDDLCNVVVVLAVLGAGLRVEKIVTCDKLKSLDGVG
jgi:hypothetical protein